MANGRRNLEKELFNAISRNNVASAKALINGRNVNINAISQQGASRDKSPLFYACEMNRVEIVEALLAADPPANINMRMTDGTTALSVACQDDNAEVVEALLSANPPPDINAQDDAGVTALMEAALAGSVECVKLLLNARPPADASIQSNQRDTARTYARSELDPRNFEIEVLLWEATEAVADRRIQAEINAAAPPRQLQPVQPVQPGTRSGGYRNKRLTRRKAVRRH